jgi:hypothetical protein
VPASAGQGTCKADALRMAAAWVRDMLDRQDLDVEAVPDANGGLSIRCADAAVLVGLVLRQRRTAAGLSLREAAERLASCRHWCVIK